MTRLRKSQDSQKAIIDETSNGFGSPSVLIVILIGGMGYLGFRSAQPNAAVAPQAIPQTVTVSRGDVEQTVTAPGRLIGTKEETLLRGWQRLWAGGAVTVSDTEGRIIEMNDRFIQSFAADGGSSLRSARTSSTATPSRATRNSRG